MHRRVVAIVAAGATAGFGLMGFAAQSSGASSQNTVLSGTRGDYANPANFKSHVEASRPVDVMVMLKLRNSDQAQALADAVSTPGNASFHRYLSTADWVSRFAPDAASVSAVKSWLSQHGLKVGAVPDNNLYVPASGTAKQVESAFATTLNDYSVAGKTVRAAANDISVGASIAGLVDGVAGIDDTSPFMRPTLAQDGSAVSAASPSYPPGGPYPPSPGFKNAPPCTKYSGTQIDTKDPAFGAWGHLPYTVCGFTPTQLRQAYGMDAALNQGMDGSGQTVAITDAYDSPTILKDAQKYAAMTDSQHPLSASQFTDMKSPTYTHGDANTCNAPGWFGEQTLDVEAVHGMAPGAHITYVAAKSCLDGDLFAAVNHVVSKHLASAVTDSWGSPEALTPKWEFGAYTSLTKQAAATGIGVYFSAGDNADWYALLGKYSTDYPASNPGVTAVGGTSLSVNQESGAAVAALTGSAYGYETEWMTGKAYLCTAFLIKGGFPPCAGAKPNTYGPPPPGFLVYGTGGGTSQVFPEPSWQNGVVPNSVATRFGKTPMRSLPDVAADADPTTGMLVGQTQAFPNGVYWATYRIGGTSLASPLFAGMMAVANQVAGTPLGFANPLFYSLNGSAAFHDIVPHGKLGNMRVDFLNGFDASGGTFTTARTFGYVGPEVPAKGPAKPLTLHTAAGWDNSTGNGTPNGWAFLSSLK